MANSQSLKPLYEHTYLNRCLVCDSKELLPTVSFGRQPLANGFLEQPRTNLACFDLAINHCRRCSHSQLSEAVDPDLLYRDYKYVSGTTTTLKEHFAELARSAYSKFSDRAAMFTRVLDIGSNDGSLLDEFLHIGLSVQGVDPAENLAPLARKKGIPVLVDFWSADTAFKLTGVYEIVTALNCLAHNADPRGFLRGIRRVLAENGIVIFEFPYFHETLLRNDFGQVYSEHHSYFSMKSFVTLVESEGFYIDESCFFPSIHGGTMRLILRRGTLPHCPRIHACILEEGPMEERLSAWASSTKELAKNLSKLLKEASETKTIVAYGASAKSSTLFNLPGMKSAAKKISYVVDDNPIKWNLFCPGSNLEIRSADELLQHKPEDLAILLTVHNFKDEVKKRLLNLGLQGVQLINYVPEVCVENVLPN